jgi:hypothetical protein
MTPANCGIYAKQIGNVVGEEEAAVGVLNKS